MLHITQKNFAFKFSNKYKNLGLIALHSNHRQRKEVFDTKDIKTTYIGFTFAQNA